MLGCALAATAGAAPPVALDTATLGLAGSDEAVDIHRPVVSAPIGTAIVAHGFGRSRHRHHDLGRALAEAGVVAIVPDLPNVMDLWSNGDAVAELTARVEEGAFGFPPVPRSRIVLLVWKRVSAKRPSPPRSSCWPARATPARARRRSPAQRRRTTE